MADLYRKSALEKISNPEQLDKALVVTSPLSWLALVAVTLILAVTIVWSVVGRIPETLTLGGYVVEGGSSVGVVYSDVGGAVGDIMVYENDAIYAGTELLKINRTGADPVTVTSDINGYITEILVHEGTPLKQRTPLMYFAPAPGSLMNGKPVLQGQLVVCFVPAEAGNDMSGKVKKAMEAHLTPAGENNQSAGYIKGNVLYVGEYPADAETLKAAVGESANDTQGKTVKPVVILLQTRQDATTGKNPYVWSNPKGQNLAVANGDTFTVRIIVKEVRPIEKLFAKIGEVLGW